MCVFGGLCEACNAFEILSLNFVYVARNRKQIPEDQCISLFPSAKSNSKENVTLDKTPQNNRSRCERRNLPFNRSTQYQSKMDLNEEFPPLGVPRYVCYIWLYSIRIELLSFFDIYFKEFWSNNMFLVCWAKRICPCGTCKNKHSIVPLEIICKGVIISKTIK